MSFWCLNFFPQKIIKKIKNKIVLAVHNCHVQQPLKKRKMFCSVNTNKPGCLPHPQSERKGIQIPTVKTSGPISRPGPSGGQPAVASPHGYQAILPRPAPEPLLQEHFRQVSSFLDVLDLATQCQAHTHNRPHWLGFVQMLCAQAPW